MRKILSTFTAVAALATVPLAAGCGADDLNPESVAEAAQATREARTAKVDMTVALSGFGTPIPLSVKGTGTSSLDSPKLDVTFDFGPLLALTGARGDGRTRVVVTGKDVFVRPPKLPQLDLPGDASWVGIDLAATLKAMGVDPQGFGAIVNADPGAQLDALTSAKGMKEVGEEKIDGVDTTHFRGTVRIKDLIAALPPERRRKAQEAVSKLTRGAPGADAPQPVDVWVDEEERIRRMKQQVKAPAQQGVPAGRADVTVDYSDFGTPLRIRRPAEAQTFDATKAITRALAAQARGGAVN